MGNKFVEGKCRPLLVEVKNKENVHWFFNNKKKIFVDTVRLSSDLTKSQRDCYSINNQERKNRLKNGEEDLIIKPVNGFPIIVKKMRGNENFSSNSPDNSKNE